MIGKDPVDVIVHVIVAVHVNVAANVGVADTVIDAGPELDLSGEMLRPATQAVLVVSWVTLVLSG